MIDIITIICLGVIVVVASLLNIKQLRERSRRLAGLSAPMERLTIRRALKQLNCKAEWRKEKDSDVAHYTYQGGHFNLTVDKDSPYVRLTYLFFFEADINDIEQVRTVCNLCNLNTDTARIVYTLDEQKAKVDLHIITVIPMAQKIFREELERSMADAFRWQNTYVTKYKDAEKKANKVHGLDTEKAKAQYARDMQLIREQEMTHQEAGPDWHENKENTKQLRCLLATAMGMTEIIPIKFSLLIDDKPVVIEDPDEILNYHIAAPLIDGRTFIHQYATGHLDFYDPRDPVTIRHMTIDFEQDGSTKDTLFYRITMTLIPVSVSKKVHEDSEQHSKLMTSVLLGYELTPAKERLAHFRYVWKEAMGKQQNDDTKDMTDEEKLLADIQDPHLAYDFYHGRSLYLRKRYYEALLPLENAFHAVTRFYDIHGHHIMEMVDELAYFIGCCYMSLHQYDRACYYLQLTLPTSHQSYSEAYINCLVNGGDYRAMDILNGLLNSLQMMLKRMNESEEDEDEDDDSEINTNPNREQIQAFINFVKRRKAYLLVSMKHYDEAESILKQLLDDPDNSDFALNELAYIQKQK